MRRFSSEGSLLGLDLIPWKSVSHRNDHSDVVNTTRTYKTPPRRGNEVDNRAASLPTTPAALQDPMSRSAKELSKELSFSVEDLTDQNIPAGLLKVTNLNESFKAYSDSQLAPHAISSDESVEKDDGLSPSPSSTPFCFHSGSGTQHHRHHVRAKLSSAKLHLKSLFGQVRGEVNSKRKVFNNFMQVRRFLVQQPVEILMERSRRDGGKKNLPETTWRRATGSVLNHYSIKVQKSKDKCVEMDYLFEYIVNSSHGMCLNDDSSFWGTVSVESDSERCKSLGNPFRMFSLNGNVPYVCSKQHLLVLG